MLEKATSPAKDAIKILVVDDHPLIRQGIISVLNNQPDMIVVGEAGDGLEALVQARAIEPDLILMDIRMPRCDGLEATRLILAEMPRTKIIILTVFDDDHHLFQAIEMGAYGYLLKDLKPSVFVDMVRGVFNGQAPISRLATARIMHEFARRANGERPSLESLSERELEILRLVAQGRSNREIAHTLNIALYTVKNHLHHILDKLHMENRIQAVVFAVREGLLDTK